MPSFRATRSTDGESAAALIDGGRAVAWHGRSGGSSASCDRAAVPIITRLEVADVVRELRRGGRLHQAHQATEIGALQVNDLKNDRIPSAGEELGSVVAATETATHTIMAAAEDPRWADASDQAAYKALVDEKLMIIFEACSFQDITGQRIAKVVETLQHIEQRVARFADVMNATDLDGFLDDKERARAERKEKFLLNGPQLAGEGVDAGRSTSCSAELFLGYHASRVVTAFGRLAGGEHPAERREVRIASVAELLGDGCRP